MDDRVKPCYETALYRSFDAREILFQIKMYRILNFEFPTSYNIDNEERNVKKKKKKRKRKRKKKRRKEFAKLDFKIPC